MTGPANRRRAPKPEKNGQVQNGQVQNGQAQNGQVQNGQAQNGKVQNGQSSEPPKSPKKGWQVQSIQSLPKFLQDNEYLLHNHRPLLPSLRQCIGSAFSLHTETINIWTHIIGCVGTLFLALHFVSDPEVSVAQKVWFCVFFAGAVICMGCSAAFHTLLCYSETVNKYLAKVDYCGIIVLIVASFPPWVNYCFYCYWPIKLAYLLAVSVLGALCIYFVVLDQFAKKEYRPIRAGLFIALGLTGVFPALHFLLSYGWSEATRYLPWLLFMAFLYIFGGVIYALRIPERLLPGKFDIWCHSHQFLHVCVMGGVLSCYCGINKLASAKIGQDCGPFTLE